MIVYMDSYILATDVFANDSLANWAKFKLMNLLKYRKNFFPKKKQNNMPKATWLCFRQ